MYIQKSSKQGKAEKMFQIHTQKRLDVSVDSNININPDYDITGIKPKDILVFFFFYSEIFFVHLPCIRY